MYNRLTILIFVITTIIFNKYKPKTKILFVNYRYQNSKMKFYIDLFD